MYISDDVASPQLKFDGIWGEWGPMEVCPQNGYALSFGEKYEYPPAISLRDYDNTFLNSICLYCSTGGQVCSLEGSYGDWKVSLTSKMGFNGAMLSSEPNEGTGDDTAADKLKLYRGDDEFMTDHPKSIYGIWRERQNCPAGEIICGLSTRVQTQAMPPSDDTGLNGVILQCCPG